MVKKTLQYVIRVKVVQAFAANTVSNQEFVTGLQAIVTEDVKNKIVQI